MDRAPGWVFQPGAAQVAARMQCADGTLRNRKRDIEQFLLFLETRNDTLPVDAEYMNLYAVFLHECEYSDCGARRHHVWRWLCSTPPTNNMAGHDTTGWPPRRWRAEKLPIRLNTNHTTQAVISAVEADCQRLTIKNQPEKAVPVRLSTLKEKWPKLNHRQRGIVVLAAATGVRTDSLLGLRPGDIKLRNPNKHRATVFIERDKVAGMRNRLLWLNCTCAEHECLPSASALCPLHSGYLQDFILPITRQEFSCVNAVLEVTGHSWRRTMALRLRKLMEWIPCIIDVPKTLAHMGWTDPKRLACYAADCRKWDTIDLIPCEIAIILHILRMFGGARSSYQWYDLAEVVEVKKELIPQMRSEGEHAKPNHAYFNASSAAGAHFIEVAVKKKQYEKGARKVHNMWVIPARNAPQPFPENWHPTGPVAQAWIHNIYAAFKLEHPTVNLTRAQWVQNQCNALNTIYVKPKLNPNIPIPGLGWGRTESDSNSQPVPGEDLKPRTKMTHSLGARHHTQALWGQKAWLRVRKLNTLKNPLWSKGAWARTRAMGAMNGTEWGMEVRPEPATSSNNTVPVLYRSKQKVVTHDLSADGQTHNTKHVLPDIEVETGDDPKILSLMLPDRLKNEQGEPLLIEQQRNLIKKCLENKQLCLAHGWKVNVSFKDNSRWEIRGTCNKCPLRKREDGTLMKGTRCGVSFNANLRPDMNRLEIRLNDNTHTSPHVRTVWPTALPSSEDNKHPKNLDVASQLEETSSELRD